MPGELTLLGRRQQPHHGSCIIGAAIEPASEIVFLDGHRHTVMQYGQIAACRGGDDRDSVEFLSVRPDPIFRQPGKTEWTLVAAMDEIGPLPAGGCMPLIVAVGRDEAATPPYRVLERRSFRNA